MGKILRGEKLVKIYHGRTVVNEVTVDVEPGQIVGLLGPNGAGKTTTFYMLTGIISPNRGKIFLDEADITKLPMYQRARRGVGYLPQEPSIFRKLTVEENLMLILEHQKMSGAERKKKTDSLIEEFGIEKIRKSKGYVLSGGERRRVEIARALATDPTFLLLDEPFTGIDPISVQELQELMRGLKYRGMGVLITDHNVRETLEITDRAYIMYDGQILISGTSKEITENEHARKHYLGDRFKMDFVEENSGVEGQG
ncbi:MAG TPA: LPS export ABC transporter ATP-binding protein [bacterium]|nr:LPS export ABC transporter ATP-binding protein [bacterium]